MGAEARADDRSQLREVVADQRHLADQGELEVERAQQVGEGVGLARRRLREEAQDALGLLLVGALAAQRGEAEQAERGR